MSTNSNASTSNSPKRTRFDDDSLSLDEEKKTGEATKKKSTAKAIAARFVAASVGTLDDSIISLVVACSKEFNDLKSRAEEEQRKLAKFADVEWFPHSIRTKVALTTKALYKEDNDFVELAGEGEQLNKDYMNAMKEIIRKKIVFELKRLRNEIRSCFFTAVKNLGILVFTDKYEDAPEVPAHEVAKYFLEKRPTEGDLCKYLPFDGTDIFKEYQAWSKETVLYKPGDTAADLANNIGDLVTTSNSLYFLIFVKGWEQVLAVNSKKKKSNALAKRLREIQLSEQTPDVEMELPKEGTMDAETMSEYIKKTIEKENKAVNKKLDKLQQTIQRSNNTQSQTSKNKRGANTKKGGASDKKKMQQKGNSNKKKKNKNNSAKRYSDATDEHGKGSSNDNAKKNNNKKKKKSSGKNAKKQQK